MIFTSKTVTVFFNDDQLETFELPEGESEDWELRFSFEPGWVVVYFFDTHINKPGATWAYPSQTVREVTSDQDDGEAKNGNDVDPPCDPEPEPEPEKE